MLSRIEAVGVADLDLPMRGSLRWGRASELARLEHALVFVRLSGGAVGVAEAAVRPTIYGETRRGMAALLEERLAPALVGLEADDDEATAAALRSVPLNHGLRGALDLALVDALARAAGTTLPERHAGPQRAPRVSFILGIDEPEAMLAEARRVVDAGVRVLKVKVGRDAAADERVLGALAAELGEGVVLYADANETLDPAGAAGRLEALARLGVAYVEEPLPVHRLRARAELRAAGILPIVADDSAFGPGELERELEADTFDILNIKPARTGWRASVAMLRRAREAGKGVMIGSQACSGLGTLHAAAVASLAGVDHPSELSFPLKLERDSLDLPLPLEDGVLDLDAYVRARLAPDLPAPRWL